MKNNVIIIGGGMAGLSAGTYLQMNGFDTRIYEMNETPGGVCTSWDRDNYTVDWCIHWLVGSGSADSFYDRWNELIDMEAISFVHFDKFFTVEDEAGKPLHFYTDLDQLEKEMLDKAPEDEQVIRKFIKATKKLTRMDLAGLETDEAANLWERISAMRKILPFLGVFTRYSRMSMEEFAGKLKNPLLRSAFQHMMDPGFPVLGMMMPLAWMHKKSAGYPIGGSLNFARKIADRYLELGGEFVFRTQVQKILTEKGNAIGIRLKNGEEIRADYVISAADGHATLFEMLEGRYLTPTLEKYYENGQTFPSLVFVALGIDRTFEDVPHSYLFPLHESLVIDPKTNIDFLYIRFHNFDPTLAPAGKTLVSAMIETRNYQYWVDLHHDDPLQYQKEKQRIAESVIRILDDKVGGVREFVEMQDVTTPDTIIHFTNNWKGSYEGWLVDKERGFGELPSTLPHLNHFYMCGHWITPGGGLPPAMMSGRKVARMICKNEGKTFEILQPEAVLETDFV